MSAHYVPRPVLGAAYTKMNKTFFTCCVQSKEDIKKHMNVYKL